MLHAFHQQVHLGLAMTSKTNQENAYASRRRCRLGPPITLAPEDAKENIWSFYPEITVHTHDTHFLPPPFSLNHIIFLSSQQETMFISLSPICQKALYFSCENKYPIVVRCLGGGFKEGMLPHHVIASYFTTTSSFIFILHHTIHHIHFMYPFHTSFFNSIFPPIHLIILHLHFSSHHVSHQKDFFLIFHYHITNYASRRPTTPILVNFFQLWVVFSSNHVPIFQNILVSRTMPGLSSHTATGKFTAQVIHCDLVQLPSAEPTRVIQLPKQRPVVGNLICGYDSLLVASFSVIGPLNLKKNTRKSR